nr:ribonuclease H-like domain-containing protein [Tanacetum cinerariifolium]
MKPLNMKLPSIEIRNGFKIGLKAYSEHNWIQQYLQNEHYALWEVIEFGDSYEAPKGNAATGSASEGSTKKKGRTVAVMTEDMQKRRNDIKARTILLLALPDEHQLRFSKYKTAQEMWAAILKTFGGNEATRKTKKKLLKQYGNFKVEGKETLKQTFNRLQAIVSHLEFIEMEDFFNVQDSTSVTRSIYDEITSDFQEAREGDLIYAWYAQPDGGILLGIKCTRHFHCQKKRDATARKIALLSNSRRNCQSKSNDSLTKSDLDTMSLDDLFNHLKVYESEVQKKLKPNSHNMAFISSAKHSSGNEDGNTACVPTASTNVPTASANVATISQDTACTYIASQSSGSQIKFEDINQIDEDDIEEMDIKWNMALLSMRADKFWKKTGKKISIQGSGVAGFDKSKVESFNCHKMGYFARERRASRSQDRGRRDNYRQGSALVADEVAPTEFTLMANTSAESKVFDNSLCSKDLTDYSRPSPTMKSTSGDDQNRNPSVSETVASLITPKPFIKFVKPKDSQSKNKTDETKKPKKPPVKNFPTANKKFPTASRKFLAGSTKCSTADMGMKGKVVKPSACNISYLSDYEPFDGGYVSFGQGGCKITGKGTIKTGKVEFKNVYFVKDLKYNLFSVLQICGNKNSVLFTDSECIVLGRDFKLLDDANTL